MKCCFKHFSSHKKDFTISIVDIWQIIILYNTMKMTYCQIKCTICGCGERKRAFFSYQVNFRDFYIATPTSTRPFRQWKLSCKTMPTLRFGCKLSFQCNVTFQLNNLTGIKLKFSILFWKVINFHCLSWPSLYSCSLKNSLARNT